MGASSRTRSRSAGGYLQAGTVANMDGLGCFPGVEAAGYQHEPRVTGGRAGHGVSPPQRPEAVGLWLWSLRSFGPGSTAPIFRPDRHSLQPKGESGCSWTHQTSAHANTSPSEFREIQTPDGEPTQDSRPPHPFRPLNLPTHRHR